MQNPVCIKQAQGAESECTQQVQMQNLVCIKQAQGAESECTQLFYLLSFAGGAACLQTNTL